MGTRVCLENAISRTLQAMKGQACAALQFSSGARYALQQPGTLLNERRPRGLDPLDARLAQLRLCREGAIQRAGRCHVAGSRSLRADATGSRPLAESLFEGSVKQLLNNAILRIVRLEVNGFVEHQIFTHATCTSLARHGCPPSVGGKTSTG